MPHSCIFSSRLSLPVSVSWFLCPSTSWAGGSLGSPWRVAQSFSQCVYEFTSMWVGMYTCVCVWNWVGSEERREKQGRDEGRHFFLLLASYCFPTISSGFIFVSQSSVGWFFTSLAEVWLGGLLRAAWSFSVWVCGHVCVCTWLDSLKGTGNEG